MEKEKFYKIYFPILEKALQNASINLGLIPFFKSIKIEVQF